MHVRSYYVNCLTNYGPYLHALCIECTHIKILNDYSYETSSTSCVHINMQQVFYCSCTPCDTTHASILDVDPAVRCYK